MIKTLEEQLEKLSKLEPNWDSYNAAPVSEKAIDTVKSIIAAPLCNGGIQLELHLEHAEFEIEITEDGKIGCIIYENRNKD